MAFPLAPTNGQLYTDPSGRVWNYTSATLKWETVGTAKKNNYVATVAPTAAADSTAGYSVGSLWVDVTANLSYTCVDSTATAAIWVKTSGGGAKVSATAPTGPAAGDLWYDSTNKTTSVWDGTAWTVVSGMKNNYAATTAPAVTDSTTNGYSVGSLWVDVTANLSYTCVDSTATAAIWVKTAGGGAKVSATAPTGPAAGDLWYDSTNSNTYVWDGSAWIDVTAAGSSIKNNDAGIVAPTTANDQTQGYSAGSRWIDVTGNAAYICISAGTGAANWKVMA